MSRLIFAHYHAQVWNASEFARSFGVTNKTVNHYLDLFTSAFVVNPLQPWHENLRQRQVEAPKVYFADTGLLHTLLTVSMRSALSDLNLPRLFVVHAGHGSFDLAENIRAVASTELFDEIKPW